MTITDRFHAILDELRALLHIHPSDTRSPQQTANVTALANHPGVPPETRSLIASVATAAAQATPPAVSLPAPLPSYVTHPRMRCKMLVTDVAVSKNPDGSTYSESYKMTCVGGDKVQSGPYPPDGSDEDNDFAKWSPSGNFSISCNNPALFNAINNGERYYVDFTLANPAPVKIDHDLQPPAPAPTAAAEPVTPPPAPAP